MSVDNNNTFTKIAFYTGINTDVVDAGKGITNETDQKIKKIVSSTGLDFTAKKGYRKILFTKNNLKETDDVKYFEVKDISFNYNNSKKLKRVFFAIARFFFGWIEKRQVIKKLIEQNVDAGLAKDIATKSLKEGLGEYDIQEKLLNEQNAQETANIQTETIIKNEDGGQRKQDSILSNNLNSENSDTELELKQSQTEIKNKISAESSEQQTEEKSDVERQRAEPEAEREIKQEEELDYVTRSTSNTCSPAVVAKVLSETIVENKAGGQEKQDSILSNNLNIENSDTELKLKPSQTEIENKISAESSEQQTEEKSDIESYNAEPKQTEEKSDVERQNAEPKQADESSYNLKRVVDLVENKLFALADVDEVTNITEGAIEAIEACEDNTAKEKIIKNIRTIAFSVGADIMRCKDNSDKQKFILIVGSLANIVNKLNFLYEDDKVINHLNFALGLAIDGCDYANGDTKQTLIKHLSNLAIIVEKNKSLHEKAIVVSTLAFALSRAFMHCSKDDKQRLSEHLNNLAGIVEANKSWYINTTVVKDLIDALYRGVNSCGKDETLEEIKNNLIAKGNKL